MTEKEYDTELGYKARSELIKTGKTTVICPKCKTHPKRIIQSENREIVKCECGYVGVGLIFF